MSAIHKTQKERYNHFIQINTERRRRRKWGSLFCDGEDAVNEALQHLIETSIVCNSVFRFLFVFFLDRNKKSESRFSATTKTKTNKKKNTKQNLMEAKNLGEKKSVVVVGTGCGLQLATTILDVASKPKKSTNRSVIFIFEERTRGGP